MNMKKVLLGTTALLGAGMLAAGPLSAAELKTGGSLDITIQGFARFLAAYGDLKEKRNAQTGAYDFRNDTEVHVIARGKDESTGIDYGATIEFEADTNVAGNTDETWIFLKGGFGEFRLGDEDGPNDLMKIGAYTIAAGTGGIDGTIIDTPVLVDGFDSGDATKIIYFSPTIAGFQLGVSYAPHANGDGDEINLTNDGGVDDVFEGGVAFTGSFGGFDIKASVIGTLGHVNTGGDDDVHKLYGGIATTLFGFKVAGGYGTQEVAGVDTDWFNVGAGASFGAVNLSVNYGKVIDNDNNVEPSNLVVSADVGLMPGVVLGGDVSWFDEDRGGGNDDGILGVVRLGVAF